MNDSGIERTAVTPPDWFDPNRTDHINALRQGLEKKAGSGWKAESYDADKNRLFFSRRVGVQQTSDDGDIKVSRLTSDFKASDGERAASMAEDNYPGWTMVAYQPHRGRALLKKLTDDERHARDSLAAVFRVKPWEVQVKSRTGGGFRFTVPPSYLPSRDDDKLDEIITTAIGEIGWYSRIDAKKRVGEIIPSDPPMFPEVAPFPLKQLGSGKIDRDIHPVGLALGKPGEKTGPEVKLDWNASAFTLLGGLPGSGKSVTINSLIASAVASGAELVIVDTPDKSVDFTWCQQWCRPGGWGGENLAEAATALGLVYQAGQQRAKILREKGVESWLKLPKSEQFNAIEVIVDELSGLMAQDPVPKGVPKDHQIVIEAMQTNMVKAFINHFITKIIAEMRFVGIRMLLSTQVTNANTGVPPSTRNKMGNFFLQGSSPSKSARNQAFPDADAVPVVPEYLRAAGKRSKGVGVVQLEGQEPAVFKSYYADLSDYRAAIEAAGVRPTSGEVRPSQRQIDAILPKTEDESEDYDQWQSGDRAPSGKPASQVAAEMGDDLSWQYDEDGNKLTGYAKANAARHASKNGS